MRTKNRRLARIIAGLLFVSLCLATGVQFPILKSVAWVGMMISNSQTAPLKVALIKTFDGKHVCNLCKNISKMIHADKTELKKSVALPTKCDLAHGSLSQPFPFLAYSSLKQAKNTDYSSMEPLPAVPPPKNLPS